MSDDNYIVPLPTGARFRPKGAVDWMNAIAVDTSSYTAVFCDDGKWYRINNDSSDIEIPPRVLPAPPGHSILAAYLVGDGQVEFHQMPVVGYEVTESTRLSPIVTEPVQASGEVESTSMSVDYLDAFVTSAAHPDHMLREDGPYRAPLMQKMLVEVDRFCAALDRKYGKK